MKKLFYLIISIVMLAAVLSGCNNAIDTQKLNNGNNKKQSTQELTYASKYYLKNSTNTNYTCLSFNKEGAGSYKYLYKMGDAHEEYTISFKYLIIEDTVVCFYDSVKYEKNQPDIEVKNNWAMAFGFSKDILISSSGAIYVCEDYFENIPNFSLNGMFK